jgi:hypothetical protein
MRCISGVVTLKGTGRGNTGANANKVVFPLKNYYFPEKMREWFPPDPYSQ